MRALLAALREAVARNKELLVGTALPAFIGLSVALIALLSLGVPLEASILTTVGTLVLVLVLVIAVAAILLIRQKQQTNTFSLIDSRLRRVSYFKLWPPIDLLNASQIYCRVRQTPFRIAVPTDLDATIAEAVRELEPNLTDTEHLVSALRRRFSDGRFALVSEYEAASIETADTKVFARIFSDAARFESVRRKVLVDYLIRRNQFHFNGDKVAVVQLRETRDEKRMHEVPAIELTLEWTDYFTFRVLSELAATTHLTEYEFPALQADELSEYCARQFQRYIHPSLAVAVAVHTLKDNRLIVTRRSQNAANPLDEADKYFLSVNEGTNKFDADPNNPFAMRPILDWVKRGLAEELLGSDELGRRLLNSIRACCITGAFLYLPNMSINLCCYAAIDCSSDDIREAQNWARDGKFDVRVIHEQRWDAQAGLPRYSPQAIHEFIEQTIGSGEISDTWDEGALIAVALSTLAYGLYV